ncbi:MAG: amino acid-binding protein [Bacteroidales bacterium]|jgi:hypothetical protein|nr:amino acid-binding protein [Bacteroidales bacterium]
MIIQQLSVFLENRSGRLTEVLEVLGKEDIRITALSVADTSEFGILRLIVTEPRKAKDLLKKEMFTVNITEVISVMIPNEARTYASILKILSDIEISVEYTYAFSHGSKSVLILRCNNNEEAIRALKDNNLNLMKAEDLYSL